MAILRRLISLILPSILLTGCYEIFDPGLDIAPVLCINSIITAGEPIEVDVTRTWTFDDQTAEYDHDVSDARVTVYANGVRQDEDYVPAEGDVIRIVAESPAYGCAEAEVKVPVAASLDNISYTATVTDIWKNDRYGMCADLDFNIRLRMTIHDVDIATDDYFRLDYNWEYPSGCKFYIGGLDYNSEPIFKEHMGAFETITGSDDEILTVFSDRRFAGNSYTLDLFFNRGGYRVNSSSYDEEMLDCSVNLTLSTVSHSYYAGSIYNWQREMGGIDDLSDLGFAQPIWGYSNVSTGAGVVAARSCVEYTISLKDFIKSALE